MRAKRSRRRSRRRGTISIVARTTTRHDQVCCWTPVSMRISEVCHGLRQNGLEAVCEHDAERGPRPSGTRNHTKFCLRPSKSCWRHLSATRRPRPRSGRNGSQRTSPQATLLSQSMRRSLTRSAPFNDGSTECSPKSRPKPSGGLIRRHRPVQPVQKLGAACDRAAYGGRRIRPGR
jgi:hypothetical protein